VRLDLLGDQAVIAYCDSEAAAAQLAAALRCTRPAWCADIVQAYVSIAVYYDLAQIDPASAADWVAQSEPSSDAAPAEGPVHVIPCCYELGLDFDRIEKRTGLTRDAVIRLHADAIYTVYAIGFCPGFPYLGYLPDALTGIPRLDSPRTRVEAGSIGLTGRQTGIYTEVRPGGWNIIGRTPLVLVDVADGYFPLRTGDRVQFQPIDERRFRELEGCRLK
jgi:inhibitor of KinA